MSADPGAIAQILSQSLQQPSPQASPVIGNSTAQRMMLVQSLGAQASPLAAPVDPSSPAGLFARNSAYAVQQPSYQTTLSPADEAQFQSWVTTNKVPFDPSATSDYDMRGFYKGLQTGNPNALTAINQNDGQMHYSDYWKTPYHKSFSAESQYATVGAPSWNSKDQLVLPNGNVVYDERANK